MTAFVDEHRESYGRTCSVPSCRSLRLLIMSTNAGCGSRSGVRPAAAGTANIVSRFAGCGVQFQ